MMGSRLKEDLSIFFSELEDPRLDRNKLYSLEEIIFLVLVSALAGYESWRGAEFFGEERIEFLRKFFRFKNGIPSHQTIGRVFSILKPKAFEDFFLSWAAQIHGSNNGKQIAFDGKTIRGSFDKAKGKGAIQILNAFAVESGITLAQLQIGSKTNEITELPKMIDSLDLKGANVSVDALNTQKTIAEKIISAGADYTLALKGNHKTLHSAVEYLFKETQIAKKDELTFTEKEHGRITTRNYQILKIEKNMLLESQEWKGLIGLGRVEVISERENKNTREERFYLLSYTDVAKFSKASRGHWGIENKLHWVLDVTYSEDASRIRKDNAPRNYSLIRKFALNIIRKTKQTLSIPKFHMKMTLNTVFAENILADSGFTRRKVEF